MPGKISILRKTTVTKTITKIYSIRLDVPRKFLTVSIFIIKRKKLFDLMRKGVGCIYQKNGIVTGVPP